MEMETEDSKNSVETDSEDSSDDENNVLETRAEELERQLDTNKYSYDIHLELVDIYRKLADLNSLRAAFDRFSNCFPLTPNLWLSWIRDEIKIANAEKEKLAIVDLFNRAIEDYISVELWLEYTQFAIGIFDITKVREIIERGLNAVGVHVKEGSLLWDTWRELELAHLSVTEPSSPDWQKQLQRVYEVFRRQLSVSLLGMESTYSEFKQWFDGLPEGHNLDPKPVEWGYNKALKVLEKYKPYEEELMVIKDETQLRECYSKYIKAVSDPSTVICLYEREVAQLCLTPAVWLEYCLYSMKLGESALSVCKRAVRNCPWSEELWIIQLRTVEFLNKDEKEVLRCFEEAVASLGQSTLELWLAYIEFVKRNVKDENRIQKLFEQANEQLDGFSDPSCKLNRWHARILAKSGQMIEARKLWNNIIKYGENKTSANVWLEFINLEKQFGDAHQLRMLFQRAVNACKDWPKLIAEEWLMFEREEGTLQDVMKCLEKTRHLTDDKPVIASQSGEQKQQLKRKLSQDASESTSNETKKQRLTKPQKKLNVQHDPKKTIFVSNLYSSVTERDLQKAFTNAIKIDIITDRKGASKCFGYVQFNTEEEVESALTRDREALKGRPMFVSRCKSQSTTNPATFKYSTETEPNKLFIKGLPIKTTAAELEQMYKPFGAVEVRLITHKSGQSKGLAYVEFRDEESAQKALTETDQKEIDGHVITVAVSAPPPKKLKERDREPVRHARSRLQVPLVPRVIQDKVQKEEKKSNEDFRKLFMSNGSQK